MARRTIAPEIKAAVLLALQNPEVNKVELAKQYGLSLPTIYNYLNASKAVATETVQA
jgi:Mor family transcriptional regulator